jgi:hypothetical protein
LKGVRHIFSARFSNSYFERCPAYIFGKLFGKVSFMFSQSLNLIFIYTLNEFKINSYCALERTVGYLKYMSSNSFKDLIITLWTSTVENGLGIFPKVL